MSIVMISTHDFEEKCSSLLCSPPPPPPTHTHTHTYAPPLAKKCVRACWGEYVGYAYMPICNKLCSHHSGRAVWNQWNGMVELNTDFTLKI